MQGTPPICQVTCVHAGLQLKSLVAPATKITSLSVVTDDIPLLQYTVPITPNHK
jgi:hypothetical protein